jgi:hypothetical protein
MIHGSTVTYNVLSFKICSRSGRVRLEKCDEEGGERKDDMAMNSACMVPL